MQKQKPYNRGRRFEYRVRDYLKRRGYYTVRSAKSGTITDLIALRDGKILLIQCKVDKYLKREEKEKLREAEEITKGLGIIAYREGRKLRFRNIEGDDMIIGGVCPKCKYSALEIKITGRVTETVCDNCKTPLVVIKKGDRYFIRVRS